MSEGEGAEAVQARELESVSSALCNPRTGRKL